MTRIIQSLAEISANYDVLFCDLWGCLHNGREAYPAAVAALQEFRRGGGQVVLLTNAPRPEDNVREQLDRLNVPHDAYDRVVSSGDAAREALFAGVIGRKVWHVGAGKDDGFFTVPEEWRDAPTIERVPLDQAEGIACTGLFDEMTEVPEDYRSRFLMARQAGLKMLCANPDIVVDMGEIRIYCAGALAEFYEDMGGEALYFGKPHPPIYDLARRRLGMDGDARVLAIGDGVNTDVAGAMAEGIDCLFVTGGLAAESMGPDVENPVPALLDSWLNARLATPQYSIGRLR